MKGGTIYLSGGGKRVCASIISRGKGPTRVRPTLGEKRGRVIQQRGGKGGVCHLFQREMGGGVSPESAERRDSSRLFALRKWYGKERYSRRK